MNENIKKVAPAGHRVLVRPDNVEEMTASGIVLAHENKKRKVEAQVTGTVVAVGSQAWLEFSDGSPWAKAGDRVLFAEFAGKLVKISGVTHRIINDEDITAVVLEEG